MKPYFKITLFLFGLALFVAGCGGNGKRSALVPYIPVWEGNWGYINTSGKKVIGNQFDYALPFSRADRDSVTWAGVNIGGTAGGKNMPGNGKWGFINTSGRFQINPKYYPPRVEANPYDRRKMALAMHQGYRFSEGLAAVVLEDGQWVYIDPYENVVIKNQRIKSARMFKNGLACVFINGYWGYINRQGEIQIQPQYLFPADFSEEGYAWVIDKKLRRAVINKQGEVLLPQYRFYGPFENGYAVIRGGFAGTKVSQKPEEKLGLINVEGEVLVEPQFDEAGHFSQGLCPVRVGSRINQPAPEVSPLDNQRHSGGRWGYIDKTGFFQINPNYSEARSFSGGFAAVRGGSRWGYIKRNGSRLTGFEFRWAGDFDPELKIARVQLGPSANDYDTRYAWINADGEIFYIERPD